MLKVCGVVQACFDALSLVHIKHLMQLILWGNEVQNISQKK